MVSYEQALLSFIGGEKLAQSRGSLNSPDAVDVASVMEAFEEINQVVLTLTGRVERAAGRSGLKLEIQAHSKEVPIGEAPSLASASVTVGSQGQGRIAGAILQALYSVDAALARMEMEGGIKKP